MLSPLEQRLESILEQPPWLDERLNKTTKAESFEQCTGCIYLCCYAQRNT